MMKPDPGLQKAFAAVASKNGKGGKAILARKLGVSKQATSRWRRVPEDKIIDVEEITGVPREELRPDLYQRRKRRRAAAA